MKVDMSLNKEAFYLFLKCLELYGFKKLIIILTEQLQLLSNTF